MSVLNRQVAPCGVWVDEPLGPAKDKEIQNLCPAYSRYNDHEMPFWTQRSLITVMFHVERKGDYYFNNILLMVFFAARQQGNWAIEAAQQWNKDGWCTIAIIKHH